MRLHALRALGALTIVAGLVGFGSFASAQTYAPTAYVTSSPVRVMLCTSLPVNLTLGSHDGYGNSSVTVLQNYLYAQGYFTGASTGYFGFVTRAAVARFQQDHSLLAYGYVGPLTRATIENLSCGSPVPTPVPVPSQTPYLQQAAPTSGAVGTSVTLYGYGFSSDNTVNFSTGTVPHVAATNNGTMLTFTVPSYIGPSCGSGIYCAMYVRQVTPGSYYVSVNNGNGTSNTVLFTVTDSTINPNPSSLTITGLDTPTSLRIGQSGTWTVRTATPYGTSGQLHYSVVWGDEANYSAQQIMYPGAYPVSSAATLTHTYGRSGTYTANFTVTDDYGHSAAGSSTITVTPLY